MGSEKKNLFGEIPESLKPSEAPLVHADGTRGYSDKPLYEAVKIHPNQSPPPYKEHGIPHPEAEIQCKFDHSRPPKAKKKKTD